MHRKLGPEQLYQTCDVEALDFKTTDDIEPSIGTIGQERAMRAIDFGLNLDSKGFNIFILGESGSGRMTSVKKKIGELCVKEPVPPDWCYVYNFKDPDAPRAISLEPGQGAALQKDMDELVKALQTEIPKVFESKEYEKSRSKITEGFQKEQKEKFSQLEEDAKQKGFSIRKTVTGLLIVPVKPSGEPLSEEEFEELDEEHKKKVEETGKQLQERLDDIVRSLRASEKQVKKRLKDLEREAALSEVGDLIDDLKQKYKEYDRIQGYLDDVRENVLDNLDDFKAQEEQPSPLPFMRQPRPEAAFNRYKVNVLVNNKECDGAPMVFESNPTYLNIFGRLEYKFQYGVATTDFTQIKAGALHRANGGYLIMESLDLLRSIFAYDGLKRALRDEEIKMEDVWERYRLMSTTTLKPEPVPLKIKVILIGHPVIYYLLYRLDEEYKELFKVKADFDDRMDRSEEMLREYAAFIASKCKEEKLLPFDRGGVGRVIEHGTRIANQQGKLSSKFREVADLLREAHFWAKKAGAGVVERRHVEQALEEQVFRSNRIEERLRELMAEGTLIVETEGGRVGQVNGLAVLSMGDYSFGKPSRITAKTFVGKAGVVNIERETKMSGRIHGKAILIISNYLGSKYAVKKPISASASITFEQLYDMVEGDSATCAELYCILSSLSGVPLKQSFAVTGSMDQNGDVQPIGGVNEKIEGFFELCKLRGLDGSHGVIIPRRNERHLMLKKDVVDAVREGKFTIYSIDRMEEGLELLTGVKAGELGPDGAYPEDTLNSLVQKRFEEINEALKERRAKEISEAMKRKEEEEEENEEEDEENGA
ncbi:MAG: AAA family ATPase [Nitrospirota bacterium]|jgi:lon-related putative ATP-dependent protease